MVLRLAMTCTLFVALAASISGCDDDQQSDNNSTPGSHSPDAGDAHTTFGTIPPAVLVSLLDSANDYQRSLIGDGILTSQEYERAKLAQVACLRDAGAIIDDRDLKLNDVYQYRFWVGFSPDVPPEQSATIVAGCAAEFTTIIDRVWAEVSLPLLQSVITDSRRWLADCLETRGWPVRLTNVDPDDSEFGAAYEECSLAMSEELGLTVAWGYEGDGRRE